MLIDVNNAESVKQFLNTCSKHPGVYQMKSSSDDLLYIGKAKNLSKRLASYFSKNKHNAKVASLVKQIHSINTTVTNTEAEALILECNLIKKLKPKYNILLRDDKSYPYICLSNHKSPRIFLYRGKKQIDNACFGPYPNVHAAKQTIRLLQQVFLIRTCTNNYFNNRTRPCLLYQINRCSAPCVDYIDNNKYGANVKNSKLFLQGKDQELINEFVKKMEHASSNQEYELAASLRDNIKKLQQIFEPQHVEEHNSLTDKATDVIAIEISGNVLAVVVLKFRQGRLIGTHEFTNKLLLGYESVVDKNIQETILSVLSQFYVNFSQDKPINIIVNFKLSDANKSLLESILQTNKISFITTPRGSRLNWLKLAVKNVNELLASKNKLVYANDFDMLQKKINDFIAQSGPVGNSALPSYAPRLDRGVQSDSDYIGCRG